MILLTVLSYNGARADGPSAQFDEMGGTIGRADNNQLVLPDPERTISRVHARIVNRAGRYAIVDNGSNPIAINGMGVGSGREHPLNIGDQIQIGAYLIEAREATGAAAPAADDPFADLFGSSPGGLAAPTQIPPARAAALPSAPLPSNTDWMASTRPAPIYSPPPAAAAPAALGPGHIPDDWDPFAPDAAHAPSAPPPAVDFGLGSPLAAPASSLSMGGADTLDDLFGLSGVAPAADPLAAARAPSAPAAFDDPLADMARTATVMPASRADHVSELNTPMSLPRQAPRPAPPPLPPVPPQPSALPAGAIFSWDDPPTDGRVVTLPGAMLSRSAPPPAPPPASARPAFQVPPAAATPSADDGALLAALLEGLQAPGLKLQALTPETMKLIGQLLRESTRGGVELLVARAALKREMRAAMTMIVSRENNPLKFSPTVEVALAHLLGPSAPGFMPPAQAMRDAFDDLRAHQLGVMAGMRAALEGVLQRFDPAQLETKLTRKSALTSLIPATRKARLWELFQELFTQLQSEAQDDFDELFGKAFLRAYEDQLDRLHGEAGPR
ncbi:FHA domain-containing protein [Rubrivivax sp. A210]|uniref:type VI secretion system-associated FHA domain protein TagH n=1 Tax=Rubrivivax sp. A210 TaxID=2772301 RepID=UPI00191A154C|nr:type VI secretion system-associated FHA domain protein TagH [Rubrivivax sp. A210]CAD5369298.1 FHA domain-containing protein [Rubrivivax sp. A210]